MVTVVCTVIVVVGCQEALCGGGGVQCDCSGGMTRSIMWWRWYAL